MPKCVYALLFLLIAALNCGCVSGRTADGRGMVGLPISAGDFQAAAGIVGAAVGGPTGALVGQAIAGAVALAFGGALGRWRGERAGWDEAKADAVVGVGDRVPRDALPDRA